MTFSRFTSIASLALGICCFSSAAFVGDVDRSKPVKVFILAGQSNMQGKGPISHLEELVAAGEFTHLKEGGEWAERDDVYVAFRGQKREKKTGKLTVGGYASRNRISPELGFGNVVGDHFDEPVLIIKYAYGGQSLGHGFRAPSSGENTPEKYPEFYKGLMKKKKWTLEEAKADMIYTRGRSISRLFDTVSKSSRISIT